MWLDSVMTLNRGERCDELSVPKSCLSGSGGVKERLNSRGWRQGGSCRGNPGGAGGAVPDRHAFA